MLAMAGLLTYSLSGGLPILTGKSGFTNSGMRLPESIYKSLQQRVLSGIFTRFPIMTPFRLKNFVTNTATKIEKLMSWYFFTLEFFIFAMIHIENSFYI
jgi:hypothetical protein